MAESITITQPVIRSAVITPNPAGINDQIILSVLVEEEEIVLYGESYCAGEFAAGEV